VSAAVGARDTPARTPRRPAAALVPATVLWGSAGLLAFGALPGLLALASGGPLPALLWTGAAALQGAIAGAAARLAAVAYDAGRPRAAQVCLAAPGPAALLVLLQVVYAEGALGPGRGGPVAGWSRLQSLATLDPTEAARAAGLVVGLGLAASGLCAIARFTAPDVVDPIGSPIEVARRRALFGAGLALFLGVCAAALAFFWAIPGCLLPRPLDVFVGQAGALALLGLAGGLWVGSVAFLPALTVTFLAAEALERRLASREPAP
jgi:hypothetical protein